VAYGGKEEGGKKGEAISLWFNMKRGEKKGGVPKGEGGGGEGGLLTLGLNLFS